ncbi:MAG: GtrA family protein [Candidatus Woesearchaeota archaeon]
MKIKDYLGKIKFRKVLGYGFISVFATLLDFSVLFSLTEFLGFFYLLSAGIAYICGMVFSYILNKYYNFHDNDKHIFRQFSKFFLVASGGLILDLVVIFVCVEFLELHYMLGRVVALAFSFTWNFLGHNFFSFTRQID